MPIIRARYPEDWEAIALRIKHEANWCCQQCQRPCRKPSESLADFLKRVKQWRRGKSPRPATFEEAPRRYLLTVAHLDQQPSNQDPDNLKALCTVCHLKFDSRFRAKQKQLKAEFFGQLSINDAWPRLTAFAFASRGCAFQHAKTRHGPRRRQRDRPPVVHIRLTCGRSRTVQTPDTGRLTRESWGEWQVQRSTTSCKSIRRKMNFVCSATEPFSSAVL